jgi:hypothetical protein
MSKWTSYQLLIVIIFTAIIVLNNMYTDKISAVFSITDAFISSSILIIFFTVILIIWGFSLLLLLQEKKGKQLFVHKLWRIMPAIFGVLLFLSFILFLVLGLTVFTNVSSNMHWILDIGIVYFLVIFYLFILSLFIRYGKDDTSKGKIATSANTAVLILLFVILFLPSL